jgi:hypothetical protein
VDITGIPDSDLEMLGYYLVETDGEFALYENKGDHFIVHQCGARRHILVEDVNDAIILKSRERIPAPRAERS